MEPKTIFWIISRVCAVLLMLIAFYEAYKKDYPKATYTLCIAIICLLP
jgi:hypothetical protein